jgi:hypothetical protein
MLTGGVFNENKTAVIGWPNAHHQTVLDTGHGPPTQVTIPLSEEEQRRLRMNPGQG